ncbi:hypothetical protein FPSE_07601, partial [Fusarium pseudograminearum CS3096]
IANRILFFLNNIILIAYSYKVNRSSLNRVKV